MMDKMTLRNHKDVFYFAHEMLDTLYKIIEQYSSVDVYMIICKPNQKEDGKEEV
jgi:hypothetical protein